jgi:hypothetical protein
MREVAGRAGGLLSGEKAKPNYPSEVAMNQKKNLENPSAGVVGTSMSRPKS